MTNVEYNARLFSLILQNAEWPYKGVQVEDVASGAKSIGIWCKALMDAYQANCRKPAETRLEAAEGGFYDYDGFKPNPAVSAALADSAPRDHYAGSAGLPDEPVKQVYAEVANMMESAVLVFNSELREFLERAHDASLADQDKSLLKFLLTCVDPPVPAERDPLEDF